MGCEIYLLRDEQVAKKSFEPGPSLPGHKIIMTGPYLDAFNSHCQAKKG